MFGIYSLLPHNFSNQALTPYIGVASGNLTLPFAPPAGRRGVRVVRGGCRARREARVSTPTTRRSAPGSRRPRIPRSRPAIGTSIATAAGRETFFYGFSNFIHYPQPVDDMIHTGAADLSYARDSFNVALNYTGTLYENEYRAYQAENPATFAGGSPIGAVAADPDNTAQLVSLTSSAALRRASRSRSRARWRTARTARIRASCRSR
jgi:hypothetical protein